MTQHVFSHQKDDAERKRKLKNEINREKEKKEKKTEKREKKTEKREKKRKKTEKERKLLILTGVAPLESRNSKSSDLSASDLRSVNI